jgi:hypothetical protein
LCGLDLYHQASEYDRVRRRVLYLAGTSRLPYAPELQSGGWPWWAPLGLADARTTALAALMHGLKAFNLYMAVDRDRWFGAPIAIDGERRPAEFAFWRRLVTMLREVGWSTRQRAIETVLVCSRPAVRAALASSLLDPMPPMAYGLLGLRMIDVAADPVALVEQDRATELLTDAHIPFVQADAATAGRFRFVVRDQADALRAVREAAHPCAAREPEVDTALWGADVLFVGTRSPRPVVATLDLPRRRARDLVTDETFGAQIPLAPHQVRMLQMDA